MKTTILLLFILPFIIYSQDNSPQPDLTKYVNPLIGTDSQYELSTGNTYPAIALPWGMNFWTPYTGKMGSGWQYTYDAFKINGFKQTHQPSPWINDYGAFAIMPVTGELKYKEEERASWFSHKREVVKPYYYQVYLGDYDTWVELAPTERASYFRVKYPEGKDSYLVIDAFYKGSYVKILPKEKKIIGYCRNNRGGVPDNFHNYFVLEFDKEFEEVSTWDTSGIYNNTLERAGEHVGAVIKFKNSDRIVNIKAASSFISQDQAELNLSREIGNLTFDQVKEKARDIWNKGLNRIRVEGGTDSTDG